MDDLARSVDARVGTTAAGQRDRMVGDPSQRLREGLLDAREARLALPAAEPRPVVLDAERNTARADRQPGR